MNLRTLLPALVAIAFAGTVSCDAQEGVLPVEVNSEQNPALSLNSAFNTTLYVTQANVVTPLGPASSVVAGLTLPPLSPLGRFVAAAVGRVHGCAITADGATFCWGDHTLGALGANRACIAADEMTAATCILGPGILPTLPPARAIAAGSDVTCAILINDDVICWGQATSALANSQIPVVGPITTVRTSNGVLKASRVIIHHRQVCAIDRAAQLWCWGDGFGAVPINQNVAGVVDYAMGDHHRCAIDNTGLWCDGENRNGQAGDIAAARACRDDCAVGKTRIAINATRVVVGNRHSCALTSDRQVLCWGSNEVRQLGNENSYLVGGVGEAVSGAVDVSAGFSHTCALMMNGLVQCWGDRDSYADPALGVSP